MKKSINKKVKELKNGLYKIIWKNQGGESLAAIGRTPSGDVWIAPTNWVCGAGTTGHFKDIEKVILIKDIEQVILIEHKD